MLNDSFKGTSRRTFLIGMSGLLTGVSLVRPEDVAASPSNAKIWDDPTPDELALIEDSFMAKEIVKVIDAKYSCAEATLLASLRYLEKPDELVHAAGSFGGGLHQGDLCGFLTGAQMAIGIAAGMIYPDDRKKYRKYEMKRSADYWKWWNSYATLHCYLLKERIPCKDGKKFRLAAQRTAIHLESILAQVKG